MKEKTTKDFDKLINQTRDNFIKEKIDYNRIFEERTQSFGDVKVYTIVNQLHSIVHKYDETEKHIVSREIYNSDLTLINEMLSMVKGEN